MSDLISRSVLLKKIAHHTMFDCLKRVTFESANTYEQVKGAMFELAQKAPAVDAVPVVHARWVKAHGMMPPEYHHRKQCSMCGAWALQDYFGRERMSHYCPNCCAKMDGGAP